MRVFSTRFHNRDRERANSLRQHGQDVSYSLHSHRGALAAVHGPHPALVQEVARQRRQGGGGRPTGCHAEGTPAAGRLREALHAEDERGPEVQRQLLIPQTQALLHKLKEWAESECACLPE